MLRAQALLSQMVHIKNSNSTCFCIKHVPALKYNMAMLSIDTFTKLSVRERDGSRIHYMYEKDGDAT